jgi:hypothetical protein
MNMELKEESNEMFLFLFDSANRMPIVEIPVYPVLWQNT